jgi:hypothetical protein
MNRRDRIIVLHPLLFAIYPIAALYAYNVAQIPFKDTYRSLLIVLAAAGGLFLLTGLLARDWNRAGLATSVVVVLFFSFGHVYSYIHEKFPGNPILGQANGLAAIWASLLILLPWFALRVLKPGAARELTRILNIVSGAALLFSAINPLVFGARNLQASTVLLKNDFPELIETSRAPENSPDIYYIILDGYGRPDMLRDLYGVEQNELLDFLAQRGFYIASESHANYCCTSLSLSSSLNYHYLNDLFDLNPESDSNAPLNQLIQHNAALKYFKARGYRTVAFATGYEFTEVRESDVFLAGGEWLNHFEGGLFRGSLAVLWLDQAEPQMHRASIHQIFDHLAELPQTPGPKFVFAHVVIPHPPFVFDQDGNPVQPLGSGDGQYYYGTRESYLESYRGQLLYTNRLAKEAIRSILEKSKTPPVIIVQGDHGPGAYMDFDSLDKSCLRERYSILNAYYLPGKADAGLYPGITPVNSFRVVFNAYFDQRLPLLDDRSYYSTWGRPFALTEVSDRLDSCAPLEAGAK